MAVQQRLPGITKTLERLTSVERAVATTLLNNPGQSYSTSELTLSTGLASTTVANSAHYGKLKKMGLIKKDGKKWRSAL